MPTGRSAFGVEWLVDFTALTTGSPTFTTVGNIDSISGPDISADVIDITPGDTADGSGNPGYRIFEPYLRDAGSITIELAYDEDDAQHQAIFDNLAVKFANRIQFPIRNSGNTTNAYFEFDGILTGFSPNLPQGEKQTATVTLKIATPPTFSAEAA